MIRTQGGGVHVSPPFAPLERSRFSTRFWDPGCNFELLLTTPVNRGSNRIRGPRPFGFGISSCLTLLSARCIGHHRFGTAADPPCRLIHDPRTLEKVSKKCCGKASPPSSRDDVSATRI